MVGGRKIFFLILLLLGISSLCSAQEMPLRAALPQLAPWSYMERGEPNGIIPEILQKLAEKLNEPIDIIVVPYSRMMQMRNHGETDLFVSIQSASNISAGELIADIYPIHSVIFANKKRYAAFKAGQEPLKIASIRGALYNKNLQDIEKYDLILSNNHEHSIRLVLAGRVDGIAGPLNQLAFLLDQRQDKSQAFEIVKKIDADKVWLQIAQKGPNYGKKKLIAGIMAELDKDDSIHFIAEKHLAEWGYVYSN